MNVSSATINVTQPSVLQGSQASQTVRASDSDGDGDGDGGRVHKSHKSHGGGGQMQQALLQALQNLGLAPVSAASQGPSTTSTSASTASGKNPDESVSVSGSIKDDLRQFMHALSQAVKGESADGQTNAGATSADSKTNFAGGLAALISQVASGTAPADLQKAFSKLASDMQQQNSTTTDSGEAQQVGAGGTSAPSTPNVSLQALLTQMQQNLGYGKTSQAMTGNIISTHV